MLPAIVLFAALSVVTLTPAQLHWASSSDLPRGATMAVVEGNPAKAGWYTVRISAPAGMVSPVHYHGSAERITVISGTIQLGWGARPTAAMVTLPAGSYVVIPAGTHHVVKMKTAAVVQVSGNGPMSMTVVK